MTDPSCVFCKIILGAEAAEVVCDDAAWLAFFPLNPATPGHTLVVPRDHIANLWEANDDLASALMVGVERVGRAIQNGLQPDGMNLITSAGPTAEQTIFHLHLHVVPRWNDDGFGKIWPTEHRFSKESLGDAADLVRSQCN